MRSQSLSAILSRSNGHDALLELLELADDAAELRKRLGEIWNIVAADDQLDYILEPLAPALSRSERLASAFGALASAGALLRRALAKAGAPRYRP
jgi:hypothetical protein